MGQELPLRESTEIQGDILAGFKKDHVRLLLLRFGDRRRARAWLGRLRHRIATTADVAAFNSAFSRARRTADGADPVDAAAVWRGVSFTYPGLAELIGGDPLTDVPAGSTQEALAQGCARRKDLLGDTGESDPAHWLFGAGHQEPVHAVLTIAADRPGDLRGAVEEERAECERHRVFLVFEQRGATLPGHRRGQEHFGFRDGVSQPGVHGFDPPDPGDPVHVKGKPGTRLIAAGEFVIGHEPDHRVVTWLPGWMRDGTFQVVRRLAQDVPGWWAQAEEHVRVLREAGVVPPDATGPWYAARLMGRWPSGTPLAHSPDRDAPLPPCAEVSNDITFADDLDGRVTPLFSHLRKTNPRDGLKATEDDEAALAQEGILDGRRVLRRGIPFGPPYDPAAVDTARGLLFISYQSDLIAQFEFIQRTWVEAGDFPVRSSPVGRDPVIGGAGPASFPAGEKEFHPVEFQKFVRTEGALYTFVPSLSALKWLSQGVIPVGGGPLEDQVFSAPLTLRRGEVISSGKARLRFQESGDLTVHDEHESERWRSGTDSGAVLAQLRPGGELAVLSAEGEPLWATPTAGHPGATLVVRTTGDVEIRSAEGELLWHTDTAH
ncbi:Dyp-type peroxidase [Streptomyces sp. NPDC059853]|uniref:Dyp-type peroxidase n=1 Tax=Streptomyces sp. NPDC059853 TaxID=3346973 RepID=UPI00365E07AA